LFAGLCAWFALTQKPVSQQPCGLPADGTNNALLRHIAQYLREKKRRPRGTALFDCLDLKIS
jgi:hypothetical protein